MKQADLGLNLTTKRTRKQAFLAEMERVVPEKSGSDQHFPQLRMIAGCA